MKLFKEDKLEKLIKKNKGDVKLRRAVEELIFVIKNADWRNKSDILNDRPDADCVHSEGFYFFDLDVYRSMVLFVFSEDKAEIIWAGSHDKYLLHFKNNKNSVENWLRRHKKI